MLFVHNIYQWLLFSAIFISHRVAAELSHFRFFLKWVEGNQNRKSWIVIVEYFLINVIITSFHESAQKVGHMLNLLAKNATCTFHLRKMEKLWNIFVCYTTEFLTTWNIYHFIGKWIHQPIPMLVINRQSFNAIRVNASPDLPSPQRLAIFSLLNPATLQYYYANCFTINCGFRLDKTNYKP